MLITKQQLNPILLNKGIITPQMPKPMRDQLLEVWFAMVTGGGQNVNSRVAMRQVLGKVLSRKDILKEKTI
jgi:hypothetical protein